MSPPLARGSGPRRDTVLLTGRGSFGRVPGLSEGRRVLVVASSRALLRAPVAAWLPPDAVTFTAFHPNPTVAQGVEAARLRRASGADLVVGIGGGSALDVAKAARVLPGDAGAADEVIAGRRPVPEGVPELLLVPTTAGTGSEVTQFATLYRGHRKVSLDTPAARADVAVVDPELTETCPADLTWTCAFDTLAHAVESLWSVRSTTESREHAVAALRSSLPVLRCAGDLPSPAERDALSRAATLAGQAIDLTRTTAAHALSYPLTAHLGIPHGLACALNLAWLAPLVEAAGPERVTDPRGHAAVREAVGTLRELFGADEQGTDLAGALRALLARRASFPYAGAPDAPYDLLVAEGLSSDRMSGMPVRLERHEARAGLETVLGAGTERKRGTTCATTG
ncbi:phosphonoacetaldehyde reductase [Streptomyces sp. NPDC051310]|uniref:phosphonoacetaldehyde reductase n=1 Tax=Streptomyces sp. NPDC051310 TaxID=3365649 RepID=UPI0037B03EE8